jgi:hypothetical protein
MPKVGTKEFPYTKAGYKQAAAARRKLKSKSKPKSRRGKY